MKKRSQKPDEKKLDNGIAIAEAAPDENKPAAGVDATAESDAFSASKFEVVELSGKQTLKAIARDLKPIWGWIALCVIVALAAVALVSFAPTYVGKVVNTINDYVNTGVFDSKDFTGQIVTLTCLYVGYALFTILGTVLSNNVMSRHFNNKLRIKMSEKIMRLPVSYIDKTSKGELIERMTDDVSVIGGTVHNIIDLVVTGFFQLVLILVLAFMQDVYMALVIVGIGVFCIIVAAIMAGRSSKYFHKYMGQNGKLYSVIEETYSGMKTVRAYGMEGFMRRRHSDINKSILSSGKRGYFIVNSMGPLMTFVTMIAFALICLIGGSLVAAGVGVTVGAVVAVVLYAQQLSSPLGSLANSMGMFQRAKIASKRIYGMLALPEMEAQPETTRLDCNTVEFKNMSFGYVPEAPVIKNLNLSVKRGQKIAIVGPTGGGKTTIVNLLMRFYDPDNGQILIDGVDTKTLNRDCVRDCFEMVLQDTWLFGGTIADNVAYGVENATREQVENACKAAFCDTFINTLSDKYDTVVTQGATNISQGQKQLLTIARAFMAGRPILILDEATSNVDTRTEILLQRAMDKLMAGRTCFVIAHRLSTIINADEILVVNDGEIIERGTHEKLMSANGFYADMFNSQYTII